MILFGREWTTVVTWRFRNETGREECRGKEEEWWGSGDNGKDKRDEGSREGQEGGTRKGREQRTVVYSKNDAASNPLWGRWHSSRGTLRWGWHVPTHERPIFPEASVAWYTMLCTGLRLMPSNQPPERETHWPPIATFYSQRPLAKNRHRLYNRPAGLGKWLRLHCNVCRPHDKESTLASLQKTIDALAFVRIFIHDIICLNRAPQEVISNCDVHFTADYWRDVARILQMKLLVCMAFHPETNAITEIPTKTVVCWLHGFTTHDQANWDDYLPLAEYAYNSSVHRSMKQTPFELDLGYELPLLLDMTADLQQPQANESVKTPQGREFVKWLQCFLGVARD